MVFAQRGLKVGEGFVLGLALLEAPMRAEAVHGATYQALDPLALGTAHAAVVFVEGDDQSPSNRVKPSRPRRVPTMNRWAFLYRPVGLETAEQESERPRTSSSAATRACRCGRALLHSPPVMLLRPILAALLASLVLVGSLSAPAAEWHRALHQDCGSQPDTCLLCHLSQGQLDQPTPPALVIQWQPAPVSTPQFAPAAPVRVEVRRQPPGRAPPSAVCTRTG